MNYANARDWEVIEAVSRGWPEEAIIEAKKRNLTVASTSKRLRRYATPRASIYAYINRIRNEHKRAYADRYAAWKLRGQPGEPPGDTGISLMAAQAVMMEIDLLLSSDKTPR